MHASICMLLLLTSLISAQHYVFKNYVLKYALGVYSERLSLRINIISVITGAEQGQCLKAEAETDAPHTRK